MKTVLLSLFSIPFCGFSFILWWLQQNWSDIFKLHGDHSVQISILLLWEILFQAITLHQADVIPTLSSYCPPWPTSLAVPLRQWWHTWCSGRWCPVMYPQRTTAQWSKSLNGACTDISSLFWEWNASKTIHLMRCSYAEMLQRTECLLKGRVSWITSCDLPHCLCWICCCSATGTAPMIRARSPFIFAARSVYGTPQITALVVSCCSNP